MAFQTALSGLNAAAGNLNVTGHNIANASTTGFKYSRAEFADVYAVSFGGVAQTATGSGVRLANVAQQFTQGNIDFTDNNLDLAISGDGFFVVNDNGTELYSRAGNFSVDRSGYVVNSLGQRLQTFAVSTAGTVSNFTPQDVQLNLGANPARETDTLDLNINLDAASEVATVSNIDTGNPATYNFSTTTTVYDSLGVTHDATMYFQKATATSGLDLSGALATGTGPIVVNTTFYDSLGNSSAGQLTFTEGAANQWTMALTIGGDTHASTAAIDMSSGTPNISSFTFTTPDAALDLGNGATQAPLTVDLSGLTSTGATVASVAGRTDTGPAGEWNVLLTLDGQIFDQEVVNFGVDGLLNSTPPTINFNDNVGQFLPANADPMEITIDFTGSTQFGASSTVNQVIQNGYTTGRLSGISIDSAGIIFARYTNGQSESLGAVALARFANPNGLQQVGDTNWAASFEAGDVQFGQAGTGTFGQIQSGALESANVDISKQLVNMIIAQRDFQANAKMISTEDAVTQTIINIR